MGRWSGLDLRADPPAAQRPGTRPAPDLAGHVSGPGHRAAAGRAPRPTGGVLTGHALVQRGHRPRLQRCLQPHRRRRRMAEPRAPRPVPARPPGRPHHRPGGPGGIPAGRPRRATRPPATRQQLQDTSNGAWYQLGSATDEPSPELVEDAGSVELEADPDPVVAYDLDSGQPLAARPMEVDEEPFGGAGGGSGRDGVAARPAVGEEVGREGSGRRSGLSDLARTLALPEQVLSGVRREIGRAGPCGWRRWLGGQLCR